jgi:1,5-anhydro-D-fructose reductase (1,5-anhydro-D-mannitol-forming)
MKVASLSFWHLHGPDYARDAVQHPELELVALWDDDRERGMAGAAAHGIAFEDDLEAILGDPSIEGVIVCSPTSEHTELVVRCIRAGKHVFMEKVLSSKSEDAETIVREARAANVALTVSLWRSDRGYTDQIAELVEDGIVGLVTSARIRDGHPFALPVEGHPHGVLPERFYDLEKAEGGALIDLCHPIYLLTRIIGVPEKVVSAFGQVTGRAAEDNAAMLMSYRSGAIGIAETSYVTRITPFTIEVHGTDGSILYSEPGIGALVAARRNGGPSPSDGPDDRPRLRYRTLATGDSGWRELDVRPDAPLALDQWVSHATTGTRGDRNLELALALSSLVEAAYASHAEGRPMAVKRCD